MNEDRIYGMVMLNDGAISVTVYPTEDDAYNDIIDTVQDSPGWLDRIANPEAVLAKLRCDRETTTPRIVYERHIEPHMRGVTSGYWMEVVTLGIPRGATNEKRPPSETAR